MKTNIQGLVFDFGRVLALFDKEPVFARLSNYCLHGPKEIEKRIVASGLERQYDTGTLTSQEFYKHVADALQLEELSRDVFFEIWCDIFAPIPNIENVLERLKSTIPRIVLSNTNEMHWKRIETLPVMKTFFSDPNMHVLSFEVGALKPNERMYSAALTGFGIPQQNPNNILFFDDIEQNVLAGREFGFNAEQFDGSRDSVQKLESILSSYSALVH